MIRHASRRGNGRMCRGVRHSSPWPRLLISSWARKQSAERALKPAKNISRQSSICHFRLASSSSLFFFLSIALFPLFQSSSSSKDISHPISLRYHFRLTFSSSFVFFSSPSRCLLFPLVLLFNFYEEHLPSHQSPVPLPSNFFSVFFSLLHHRVVYFPLSSSFLTVNIPIPSVFTTNSVSLLLRRCLLRCHVISYFPSRHPL